MVGAVAVLPRTAPHPDEIRFIKSQDQSRDAKKPRNPEFSKRYASCENLDTHRAKGKERKQLSYKNTFFSIIENKFRPKKKNKHHKSTDNLQLLSPAFDQQYGRETEGDERKAEGKSSKGGKVKDRMRGWRDLGRDEEVEYRQVDNKFYKEGDRKFLDVQDLRPEDPNFRNRFSQELLLEEEVGGRKKKQFEDELEQQRKKIHQELKFYNKTGLPLIGTKSELERAIENYKYSKLKKEDSNKKTQLEQLMEDRNAKNAQRGRSSCSPSGSDVSTSSGENRYLY